MGTHAIYIELSEISTTKRQPNGKTVIDRKKCEGQINWLQRLQAKMGALCCQSHGHRCWHGDALRAGLTGAQRAHIPPFPQLLTTCVQQHLMKGALGILPRESARVLSSPSHSHSAEPHAAGAEDSKSWSPCHPLQGPGLKWQPCMHLGRELVVGSSLGITAPQINMNVHNLWGKNKKFRTLHVNNKIMNVHRKGL